MKRLRFLSAVSLLVFSLLAGCEGAEEKPPANAKPLSEIARTIEQRADFEAFEGIEFEDGVYEAEYYAKDGSEKKVRLDPVSGAEQ